MVYAAASRAAGRDERLTPADRASQAERYAARAVGLLYQALAGGYFNDLSDRRDFLKEPLVKPLEGIADFKRLRQAVEEPATAPKP
jgi:hypothetical protein